MILDRLLILVRGGDTVIVAEEGTNSFVTPLRPAVESGVSCEDDVNRRG